jgi:hypothetical protein
MGSRLSTPIARISLAGYVTRDSNDGRTDELDLDQRPESRRILVAESDHFEVELRAVEQVFTGG